MWGWNWASLWPCIESPSIVLCQYHHSCLYTFKKWQRWTSRKVAHGANTWWVHNECCSWCKYMMSMPLHLWNCSGNQEMGWECLFQEAECETDDKLQWETLRRNKHTTREAKHLQSEIVDRSSAQSIWKKFVTAVGQCFSIGKWIFKDLLLQHFLSVLWMKSQFAHYDDQFGHKMTVKRWGNGFSCQL